jgi:hypothetical protein
MSIWLVIILVVVVLVAVQAIIIWRRGYPVGGDVVVRCRQGHLFTTIWVPGASFKAVRLGTSRFQWCPVGKHFTVVTLVRESDLTDVEVQRAHEHHDVRIP